MKVVMCTKIGNLKDPDPEKRGVVETLDMPEPEMKDEGIKIKVAYCAICGSDPHQIGGAFGPFVPVGMGHELSGVVVEVGKKATKRGIKVGDRVGGNFIMPCGTCYYCRNGQEQFCRSGNREYHCPGMAEYVVWHESQVFKLPDSVSLRQGCILEPVSVIVRMMDKTNIKFGQRVAVSGGGPIGLLGLQALKMYGASELTLIEPIAERRELGLKYGATHVIDPINENLYEKAMEYTNDLGYDLIVDVSGAPAAASPIPSITAKGGRIVYGAMYPNEWEMPINLFDVFYHREITITGMFVSPYAFNRAAQMLPRFDLEDLTAKVFPIDQSAEAFAAHISGKWPKILSKCNDDLD